MPMKKGSIYCIQIYQLNTKSTGYRREIPHTGDTESLNLCRQKHQQKFLKQIFKKKVSYVRCQASYVTCNNSLVICHVSHGACHMSQVTKANSHSPANSPTMLSRMFAKNQKSPFFSAAILAPFCAKISNSDTTLCSLLFSTKSFCYGF